jgi:hypothetical protein
MDKNYLMVLAQALEDKAWATGWPEDWAKVLEVERMICPPLSDEALGKLLEDMCITDTATNKDGIGARWPYRLEI